jgi:glycosyltransferase involved in cell wall biosynthesis
MRNLFSVGPVNSQVDEDGGEVLKISIACCTYNGEKYLSEQLESFAAQTRLPDEIVICDDCSTDSTRDILTAFAGRAAFPVSLCFNERNLGFLKNFEKAIALCTGDLIFLSDQDDVWRADKLELMEAEFDEGGQVGMVYADAELVDEALTPLNKTMWQLSGFTPEEQKSFVNGKAFDMLLTDGYVYGSSMAFRSEFRDLILPFPTETHFIHDNWTALMVSAVAEVRLINELLIKYRQHGGQSVGMQSDGENKFERLRRVYKYDGIINQLNIAEKRLLESRYRADELIVKIEPVRKHLGVRSGLPGNFLGRLSKVGRELLGKRYHLYSNGFRSAIKDLLISDSGH